jgi:hypothetical protein
MRGGMVCSVAGPLLGVCLAACTGAGSGSGAPPDTSGAGSANGGATLTSLSVNGHVLSGSSPVSRADVRFYLAGTPAASSVTVLAQTTSDAQGSFTAQIACPAGPASSPTLIYATASGGSVASGGSGAAPSSKAIVLLASLGPCITLPTAIVINELTTVAAAYALSPFLGSAGVAGNWIGVTHAMATAALLADWKSGSPAASLPPATDCTAADAPPNCEPRQKLGALANALAACVRSASAGSPPCLTLFTCATPGATDPGSGNCTTSAGPAPVAVAAPVNTLEAASAIARYPGLVSASGIYRVAAGASAYADMPSGAPNDWTLALTFTGGGLSEPTGLAVDAAGNVWVANYNSSVTELSPTGMPLSPASGFTGGGLNESFGIAIAARGHVWVCNEQSDASVNEGLGSVTELAPDGSVLSGPGGFTGGGVYFPEALTVDTSGNVWLANFGNSTLAELGPDGVGVSPGSGYSGGGLSFPVALALDESGQVWVADQGANQVSEFAASGARLSPSGGFTGGGLDSPQAVAVDQRDHVWVTNYYGGSVTELDARGVALSPAAGYTGGGLSGAAAIAIDGAGRVWVTNYWTDGISELSGSAADQPGTPLSPASGFTARSMLEPLSLAVDPSGNLWVSNFGNDTVTEFIGIAAPVATPTIGVPRAP